MWRWDAWWCGIYLARRKAWAAGTADGGEVVAVVWWIAGWRVRKASKDGEGVRIRHRA